ncbi:alpha/beta hydrolase [Croceicoccus sp. F390]|uniref:Alpha/beta hydrolase n=1 Tax=Croceicoccus esteveae TaxID=3075597 RepID=A0ABU2ZKV0_9SPHN|nr:alpha/beta hydrolase [Croceicoccus sp. F390]MDT0576209.1 alpha/beta hydrolase [Croceicoccus sp. F390]
MPLNPAFEPILEAFAGMEAADWSAMDVGFMRQTGDAPIEVGEQVQVASVRDLQIPLDGRTLAARLYLPLGTSGTPPLTLYLHGGGWVMGTLDTHDRSCRELANASSSAILSLAYRLAPEAPYPAAVHDSFDALCWAEQHASRFGVDVSRLAVAGDSAGGNLAMAAALLARDRGPTLRHQLLLYPVVQDDFGTGSYGRCGNGRYFLSTEMMQWFWKQYLGDTQADAAPLAALLQNDDLSRLPTTTIMVGEYDPLHDEGVELARRLSAAGVATELIDASGMIHGFFAMSPLVPDVGPYILQAGAALRKALEA